MGWLRCAVYRIILYIKPDANWNLFENYCLIMLVPPFEEEQTISDRDGECHHYALLIELSTLTWYSYYQDS